MQPKQLSECAAAIHRLLKHARMTWLLGSLAFMVCDGNSAACQASDPPLEQTANATEVFSLSEISSKLKELPPSLAQWQGFPVHQLESGGRQAMIVMPKMAHNIPEGRGKPWVWIGEFPHVLNDFETRMLREGFAIVYLPTPNQFGLAPAMKAWEEFYDRLTRDYGFDQQPALVGISRGGLYVYNWASRHPDKVCCIYGDAPVCDILSWPAGQPVNAQYKGPGSAPNWKALKEIAGIASDAEIAKAGLSPIDQLEPLAKANIPLLHVYGDADEVVPWDENTGVLATRYKALGGEITLIPKPGVKHHPHGLTDSTPIVEFVKKSWLKQ